MEEEKILIKSSELLPVVEKLKQELNDIVKKYYPILDTGNSKLESLQKSIEEGERVYSFDSHQQLMETILDNKF